MYTASYGIKKLASCELPYGYIHDTHRSYKALCQILSVFDTKRFVYRKPMRNMLVKRTHVQNPVKLFVGHRKPVTGYT